MRLHARCFAVGSALLASLQPARGQETVVHGTVRMAQSRTTIVGVVVAGEVAVIARDPVGSYRLHLPSTTTDSSGRFTLRVPRSTSQLDVWKDGFLDFQYPLLELSVDTLVADIELRPDPVTAGMYGAGGRGIPSLCVIIDNIEATFVVLHSCQRSAYDASEFLRRAFKHNPESPYFGAAGDWGGVIIYTRIPSANQRR